MRNSIAQLMTIIALLFFTNLVYAQQPSFGYTYDPKFTRMNAIEGNNVAYSPPPVLTPQEYEKLPKAWDGYCPACTLKDESLCQQRPCQKYNLMGDDNVYQGIQAKGDAWMKMACVEGLKAVQHAGGPFATIIVQIDDETNKVIRYWVNHNHVAEWTDPTAHAEVTNIRAAAKELGVLNLGHINKKDSKLSQPGEWSHCVMYSSIEPCPMCLAALYWSGIKTLIFAATRYDAAVKGVEFSDKMIYDELARPYAKRQYMHVMRASVDNSLDAFNYYKRNNVARFGEQP